MGYISIARIVGLSLIPNIQKAWRIGNIDVASLHNTISTQIFHRKPCRCTGSAFPLKIGQPSDPGFTKALKKATIILPLPSLIGIDNEGLVVAIPRPAWSAVENCNDCSCCRSNFSLVWIQQWLDRWYSWAAVICKGSSLISAYHLLAP
jgi:hypothetical protein